MSPVVDEMLSANSQIAIEHQIREKVINEEFKIWKKTVPLLYNTIYTRSMKWPSLTVDFSPKYIVSHDKNSISVSFVTGTNTSSREKDTVALCTLKLPSTFAPDYSTFAMRDYLPIPLTHPSFNEFNITRSWFHSGEVNRAKFSPNGQNFVTFDNTGSVHLFNIAQDDPVDLKFHTQEGYCLEWVSGDKFLSGANDCRIALWNTSCLTPVAQYNTHHGVINDISYSKASGVLFGSVADDFTTQLHDLRTSDGSPAIKIYEKHLQNAIQLHPEVSHLFATGGKDNMINIYDARNTKNPIRKLHGHNDSVFGLRWDTTDPLFLHSWGLDKRVITWDLNYMNEDYAPASADPLDTKKRSKYNEDPCLYFIHAGHTNRVNDLAVHPTIPRLFATVGDDTLLEVYQPKSVKDTGNEKDAHSVNDKEKDVEVESSVDKQSSSANDEESFGSKSLNRGQLGHDRNVNFSVSPIPRGMGSIQVANSQASSEASGNLGNSENSRNSANSVSTSTNSEQNSANSANSELNSVNSANPENLALNLHGSVGINPRPLNEKEKPNSDVDMVQ